MPSGSIYGNWPPWNGASSLTLMHSGKFNRIKWEKWSINTKNVLTKSNSIEFNEKNDRLTIKMSKLSRIQSN